MMRQRQGDGGSRSIRLGICRIIVLLLLLPPTTPTRADPRDAGRPSEGRTSIYLVNHGWHAGIVIRRANIPPGRWAAHGDFPRAEYLEVGWGDKDYYMTRDPNPWIAIKAALFPTASVLHVVGFRGSVTQNFPRREIVEIELSDQGFNALCRRIEGTYATDDRGLAHSLGRGLYGDSRFYAARDFYHGFNNSNVWTARALLEAGCPIAPAAIWTIDELMTRASTFGTVVQLSQLDRGGSWQLARDGTGQSATIGELGMEKCR